MLSKPEREILFRFINAEWNSQEMHEALADVISLTDGFATKDIFKTVREVREWAEKKPKS